MPAERLPVATVFVIDEVPEVVEVERAKDGKKTERPTD